MENNKMEIAIFAKARTTKEGKSFHSYLSRITNKRTGEELPVTVKFRDDCKPVPPTDCPCNIVIEKEDTSLSSRKFTTEDGTAGIGYTLWVGSWDFGGEFVDHSMDDFF